MHPRNDRLYRIAYLIGGALVLTLCPLFALAAQAPQPANPHTPPVGKKGPGYVIKAEVNEVVLHATVVDRRGRIINDLGQNDFKVYEDGAPQSIKSFSHADVPVTMGIVIDDSGSMRDKRQSVNAAALIFAKTSNPQDQVFVVNFNDVYYLDTPGDFASTIEDLKAALDKIDSRGGTALRDAVIASLDHLKLGNRDKKVLLVITDGDDNASRYSSAELMERAQKSSAVIYTIGLLGSEEDSNLFKIRGGEAHRAAKVLKELADATGGESYLPKSLDEVNTTCRQIARDIRNQYTLVYSPSNVKKDGSFRNVRVDAFQPHTKNKLTVRTRPGYFAPKASEVTPAVASN